MVLDEYFTDHKFQRFFFFFLHTLFQFGLTTASIQSTGLINAKHNNTLYGTINANRLNILILILNNIFNILSLRSKQIS